jgi:hypothetical protein
METFILQEYISNTDVCDELIKLYTHSPNKSPGRGLYQYNPSIKKSTDMIIHDSSLPEVNAYTKELSKICNLYKDKYIYADKYAPWTIKESMIVQHYKPNEGYYIWHTERGYPIHPFNNRHLVFMTYLNDVEDEGETEFYYQKLKVKPRKGLTLIWPADWTHTHKGIPSTTQDKYIITGWFSYYE